MQERGSEKDDGQDGKREEQIGETHQHVVDEPSVIARDRADPLPDQTGDEAHEQRDLRRRADPVERAAEVVASELVRAERVRPTRAGVERVEVHLLVPVRSEPGGKEPGGEDQDQEDEARDGQTVLKKAAEGPRPVATRLACELQVIQFAEWCRGHRFEVSYDVVPARTSTGI